MSAGATPVFVTEDSVFFVGGRGTKAGDAYAGGCTKDYWGDLDSPNISLSDVMGANGEVLSAAGAWNGCQTACSITLAADTCHILVTKTDAFPSPIAAGLVVYMKFHAGGPYVGDDGRYEILDVVSDDAIVIDVVHIGDDANHCDAKVGGAFSTLQIASDNTDANSTSPHNVFVLTNKPKTYGAATPIDIDAGGGDLTLNTWKRIIGIDDAGVELADGSWMEFDGNGYACDIFNIDLVDNIDFCHIKAVNSAASHSGFHFEDTAAHYGFVLNDCATNACYGVIVEGSAVRNVSIIGGKYEAQRIALYAKSVFGCVVREAEFYGEADYVVYCGYYGATIENCIIHSNGTIPGINATSTNAAVVKNCVIYNVTHCIELNHASTCLVEYNNIFVVAAKATGKAINRTLGGIAYSDYSCLWALDGAPAASGRWGGNGLPANAIEQDPQFVDADNGDFRLELSSPCLRTGRSTLGQL